jgi:hypothetical protein
MRIPLPMYASLAICDRLLHAPYTPPKIQAQMRNKCYCNWQFNLSPPQNKYKYKRQSLTTTLLFLYVAKSRGSSALRFGPFRSEIRILVLIYGIVHSARLRFSSVKEEDRRLSSSASSLHHLEAIGRIYVLYDINANLFVK